MEERLETAEDIIVCRDVHKWFGDFHVLRGVSVTIKKGEVVVIAGPSGSGKSTFIRTINRLEEHQKGDIVVDGIELTNDIRNIHAIREEIGMVFQFFNLLPNLSASENVALPLLLEGIAPWEARDRVDTLLNSVSLEHRKGHLPHELSGGEMQRVAIARALANNPKVLLADEPTGNLDSHTGGQILRLIRETSVAARCTVILATHSTEAADHADRIITLRDGMVLEEGSS